MDSNGFVQISDMMIVFRYVLPLLKIYNIRVVNYKSSILAMNIGTQHFFDTVRDNRKTKRILNLQNTRTHTYVCTNLLSSI